MSPSRSRSSARAAAPDARGRGGHVARGLVSAAMSSSEQPDELARAMVLAVAAGRIVIGAGAFFATRRALSVLGFEQPSGAAVALARLAGGRDIALGVEALRAGSDRERLREAATIGAFVDAGDALAFATALVRRDDIDRTAALNVPIAASAVIAGIWALRRL